MLFDSWRKLTVKAENNENQKINSLGKNLKSELIKLQQKEFPKMRKKYAEIVGKKLWEENIEVKVYGYPHTTLEFQGALFANNKNKKDFQETLNEMFHLLRFKRVNYKWYKYDDQYTYYTLKTAKDNELVSL